MPQAHTRSLCRCDPVFRLASKYLAKDGKIVTTFDKRNARQADELRTRAIEQIVRRMMRPLPVINRPGIILGNNDVNGFRDAAGVYHEYWKAGDIVTDDDTSNPIAP